MYVWHYNVHIMRGAERAAGGGTNDGSAAGPTAPRIGGHRARTRAARRYQNQICDAVAGGSS